MHDFDFEITEVPVFAPARLTRDDELSAREWFSLAWRPAGSRSLSEGWVRTGAGVQKPRTRPVPPPKPKLPPRSR